MTKSIKDLSKKYLQLSEENGGNEEEDLPSLKREMSKWEEKMEGLDEEDRLHEIAESKYQEARQKVEEIEENINQLDETRQELLEKIANRFVPQDEWMNKEVIKAVNKVLTGRTSEVIHVKDEELDSDHSAEPEEIFDIAQRVRRLAEDKLGETEEVKDFWNNFKDQKKFAPFKAIAEAESKLDRSQIVDRIEEDVDKNTVGSRIRTTIHQSQINPYYRDNGYSLSLTGKYLKENFMDVETPKEGDSEVESSKKEDKQEESSKKKSKQQKFYDTVSE